MGNSNENIKKQKKLFVNKTIKEANNLLNSRENLRNSIIKDEAKNRKEIDNKKNEKNEQKFELNILIYSKENIDNHLINSIKDYNKDTFKFNIKNPFIGYTQENSKLIKKQCENDFQSNKFKNVIILPIKSFSNLKVIIEEEGKDIFADFNSLSMDKQPFFLIIDEEERDFIENPEVIKLIDCKDKESKVSYLTLMNKIDDKIIEYNRLEKDFQIKIDFVISEDNQINEFKKCILKKKNNNDNFEVFVNGELIYQTLYNIENIDIKNESNFEEKLKDKIKSKNYLKISLLLFNVNREEYFNYLEQFEVKEVKFLEYRFISEKIKKILANEKYKKLDTRNFKVLRAKQSPKNNLLKYAGYYNQLGDFLFYERTNFYFAKINIAVGGYKGAGKSTLINTILGEKRCLEGKGGSLTNYISQFSLKDFPIDVIDFPGFEAETNGKKNASIFLEDIKNKISDLKKMNEIIHCFLFCIKLDQRIFDEKDNDMIKVFKTIIELKIRTFFIITVSEKKGEQHFEDFKKIIIRNLSLIINKIKKNNEDLKPEKSFGDDLNKDIIPILSNDMYFSDNFYESFGLDVLFKVLYDYFLPKKIILKNEKDIFLNEEKLKKFINNNELLQIFESKRKLSEDFRNKLKIECNKFLLKIYLRAPKYIYSFTEETLFELANEIFNHIFHLLNYYLNQKGSAEKYHLLYSLPPRNAFKNIINKDEILKKLEEDSEGKKFCNEIKNNIPWYVKVFFPIFSPLYYVFGYPIIKYSDFFSNKIINYFLKETDINDLIFKIYFHQLAEELNKGIDGFDKIRKKFEDLYIFKHFDNSLIRIITDIEDDIDTKDLNKIKRASAELLIKNIDPIKKAKESYDLNLSTFSSYDNNSVKNEKIKTIFNLLKEMKEGTIEANDMNDFMKKFRKKYGILRSEISDNDLKDYLAKNEYNELKVVEIILNKLKYELNN